MYGFKHAIRSKRLIILVVALALLFGNGFTAVTANAGDAGANVGQESRFNDIGNHWAREQILEWSGRGLVAGYDDGTFEPERGVTRAEFITFINRAYGLTQRASTAFSDVSPRDWFSGEIAKAVAAGYITGYSDGTIRPAMGISRQEAAVILYKLLRLRSMEDERWVEGFNDSGSIAAWGREYVNSAVAGGYLSGYPDGTFKPDRIITRAETVALLIKAVGRLYNAPGTYGPGEGSETVAGNVTVSTAAVTLNNLIIDGNLYLTAGIGNGDFEANGVVVKGRTVISGGGEESIVFENSSLNEVIVYIVDGKVRVVARGDTDIDNILLQSGAHLQEDNLTGSGFGDVQVLVLKPGETIELEGDFDRVSIETAVGVSVTGNTFIGELEVAAEAEGTNINTEKGTMIKNLTLNAASQVTGHGSIQTANVNTDDYSFEKQPEKMVGGVKRSSPGGGGGGGGGGGKEDLKVSAISVTTDPVDVSGLDNDATVAVTLTTSTSGAKIYYTLDGTTPTANSTPYDKQFTVKTTNPAGETITVKAIGIKSGYTNSAVTTKAIVFKAVEAPEPAITMTAGDATIEDGKVTLSVTTKNTDVDYAGARYGIKVNVADDEGDTISVSYGEGLTFNLNRIEGTDDFVGYFGPAGGFTITNGWDVTTNFTVDFGTSTSDRTAKVDAWVGQAPTPPEEEAVATMEQVEITIPAIEWLAALSGINDYLTPAKYVYADAPGALEEHLATLGLDVDAESDYAALDKTETGGKNRKTAVFYDLNNNKPSKGYDLDTLTTYFNDMVATRLVTEESMDLVNNAENIEALNGISFVIMLLERFQTVSYKTHSDIPIGTKISTLQNLVERYYALDANGQAAVLAKIIEKRPADGYARSQATTDAIAAALAQMEATINERLSITNVAIADNKAYASTAAGGGTVRVLGYGVGINLDAKGEGKKVSDATSIVIELYEGDTFLGQQTFNATGYGKHGDKSAISGTIDAGGEYVATSWDNSWFAGIDQIPDKAVATVQYSDGTATAEKDLSFTAEQTKIFFAAETVHALFEDVFADELVLADGVTQDAINAASALVEAVTLNPTQNKAVLLELIATAQDLLNGDGGAEQGANIEMMQVAPADPVAEEASEIDTGAEVDTEEPAGTSEMTADEETENELDEEEETVEAVEAADEVQAEGDEETVEVED